MKEDKNLAENKLPEWEIEINLKLVVMINDCDFSIVILKINKTIYLNSINVHNLGHGNLSLSCFT